MFLRSNIAQLPDNSFKSNTVSLMIEPAFRSSKQLRNTCGEQWMDHFRRILAWRSTFVGKWSKKLE